MEEQQILICIFPYIELEEPIFIRDELLFPFKSMEKIVKSEDIKEQLKEVQKYFYWFTNENIDNITCAILPPQTTQKQARDFKLRLEEIRKILGYFACRPSVSVKHDNLLSANYEHVNYYLFSPLPNIFPSLLSHISFAPPPDFNENGVRNYVNGYEYWINQAEYRTISTAGSGRIYPPRGEIRLALRLELILDLLVNIQTLFSTQKLTSKEDDRILNALEWYNRSCKADATTDLSLVYLAVAFETLLSKRRDEETEADNKKKTQILYDAIQFVVGDTPRLSDWIKQFYDARSRILHEGEWSQLRFVVTEEAKSSKSPPKTNEYGYLTHYGWLVFRACINAKLAGLSAASEMDLKSKFFNHEERLKRIEEALSNISNIYEAMDSIFDDIKALTNDPFPDRRHPELVGIWRVGKLLAKRLLEVEEINSIATPDQIAGINYLLEDVAPEDVDSKTEIVKYALYVFENATELPEEDVRSKALKELTSKTPPSVLEMKNHIIEILRRNKVSENLEIMLKNIIYLIDTQFYYTKLHEIKSLQTHLSVAHVIKRNLYTFLDAYSRYATAVIKQARSNVGFYLIRHDIFLEDEESG